MITDISTMTIVKNNGGVEIISKTKEFDLSSAKVELGRELRKFGRKKEYTEKEFTLAIERYLKNNKGAVIWIKKN